MKLALAATAVYATLAAAICHNSAACLLGGDDLCNWTCKRQGNPTGGRCLDRDGCPGYSICACYPKKRSNDVVDGDKAFREVLKPVFEALGEEAPNNLKERSDRTSVDKRSICCSLIPPFSGLCCDAHCTYIGKNGGSTITLVGENLGLGNPMRP
ncbi:hypothetical protein Purlil1_13168 [Purpureocillium lilacinum]|uniref:Invertebrate defensins family profile domain-containing protein n=1 Tax=Purpureocillium lilacinum TaxID=33203 RepID=A0ABR0BET3_PURLI|nr:hypothetical protein Purlil1_13168 [Purpureocillium lilacinum]